MSDRTAIIKLVAIADVQLKAGQEIDAEITIPDHGISATEIAKNLVLMVAGGSREAAATGRAAAIAMGLELPTLPPELESLAIIGSRGRSRPCCCLRGTNREDAENYLARERPAFGK